MAERRIGLLLGTEEDWPEVFEMLVRDAVPEMRVGGERVSFRTERIPIEPFDLRSKPPYDAVIDRVAYWYPHPREWLKKVALMDDVYLLNNPFTFQSMEKHSAFCGMIRLGLDIPETWLLPSKQGPDHEKYEPTARKYNRLFDLDAIASSMGYPHYIKPYDGGAWVGVTRVEDKASLESAYDGSGRRMMHLQKSVEDFDVFARSLSIGPQTMVMHYRPERPMHERYEVDHGFLSDEIGSDVLAIGRLINAFFRWEFNSCETIIKDGRIHPIDFANAVPDVALVSLHHYFPWAMSALVRWTVFCVATNRRMKIDMNTQRYFDIADREDLAFSEKLDLYREATADYFEEDRFRDFVETHLAEFDDRVREYFDGDAFDGLLVRMVKATFPEHEHDRFIDHFRGLIEHWVEGQAAP